MASDSKPRRIAVIIGTGGSSRSLLNLVPPLLLRDRGVEMQGIFIEEAEIQHAAELPFVQELCRVTFSVREFNSDHFERALALRMRTAQRALSVLARRAGVVHTFRNVRGPAVKLLLEAVTSADVTVFEPVRRMSAAAPRVESRRGNRIVVAVADVPGGRMALRAAEHLSGHQPERITVLLAPDLADDVAGQSALLDTLPAPPARVMRLPGRTVDDLVAALRGGGTQLLVIAATEDVMAPSGLQKLRDKVRCPICIVRRWGEGAASDAPPSA